MKLFFFGTLMDPHVVSMVTGLSPNEIVLKPAFIRNFLCKYAKGASFPVLVPTNEDVPLVEGRLFETDSEEILARLDRYEGNLYYPEMLTVLLPTGEPVKARVYLANWDRLSATDEDWTYEKWKHRRDTVVIVGTYTYTSAA